MSCSVTGRVTSFRSSTEAQPSFLHRVQEELHECSNSQMSSSKESWLCVWGCLAATAAICKRAFEHLSLHGRLSRGFLMRNFTSSYLMMPWDSLADPTVRWQVLSQLEIKSWVSFLEHFKTSIMGSGLTLKLGWSLGQRILTLYIRPRFAFVAGDFECLCCEIPWRGPGLQKALGTHLSPIGHPKIEHPKSLATWGDVGQTLFAHPHFREQPS